MWAFLGGVAHKVFSFITCLVMVCAPSAPLTSQLFGAAPSAIRQEVNITDAYLYAGSATYATSSEIISLTDNNYTSPKYYFEVVASTTGATTASVDLVNATSSAILATVSITGGNTYTRYRSAQFVPNASTTITAKVRLNNESIGKGILSARVIVLQSNATISSTETQIEIGSNETYTSNATSTFASPKYWYYNQAGWDGSPTFTATVTYARTIDATATVASTTDYLTAGTFTYVPTSGATQVVVKAWGGGGSGGTGDGTNRHGGGGGAGGQYAQQTISTPSGSHTLHVAAQQTTTATAGNQSDYDTTTVVAKGGAAGTSGAGTPAGGTGNTTGCVGATQCSAGGNGAAGATTGSGGGGGGAGTGGTGGNAATQTHGTGTATGGGNGGDGNTSNTAVGGDGVSAGGGGGGGTKSSAGGKGAIGRITLVETVPNVAQNATTTIALQEDNGQFASWITAATLVGNGTASSPTLTAAVSFTPHDGKHYRIVFSNGYNGATFAIYNAKILVDQGPLSLSYSETNQDNTADLFCCGPGQLTAFGESFTSLGGALTSAKFYLKKGTISAPTGNATAVLYAETHSTAFGTDSIVTGSALATSDNFNVATLSTSLALITFTFTGVNQYAMSAGTNYVIDLEWAGTGSSADLVSAGVDSTAPTYPGNAIQNKTTAVSTDAIFYLNSGSTPSLLEPQYLLAPYKLPAGTGLQNFLTLFDPAEWAGSTNNYLFDADADASSASVLTLKSSDSVTTYATVSSPNNEATSTLTCIPSTSTTMDTAATTNNNDVYASRILVQVGSSQTSNCSSGPSNPITPVNINGVVNVNGIINVRN